MDRMEKIRSDKAVYKMLAESIPQMVAHLTDFDNNSRYTYEIEFLEGGYVDVHLKNTDGWKNKDYGIMESGLEVLKND